MALGPVYKFCAPEHLLCSLTCFRRFRARRDPFSRFVVPDAFSVFPCASSLIFEFYAPEPVFRVTGGIGSCFPVLHYQTHFWHYRASRVLFSSFALPEAFSALPRCRIPFASFALPEGFSNASGTHVSRYRMRFLRYLVCRAPFSRFALPDAFSVLPSASGPDFMFRYTRRNFGLPECVGHRFALRNVFSAVPSDSSLVFTFCAPGRVFGVTECVGSRFHVLCTRTRFRRFRVGQIPFSNFPLPVFFSSLRSGSVGSRFQVLRSRTRFWRIRVGRVPFLSFAPPDAFSASLYGSGRVFKFCAPGLVFGVTECVGCRVLILHTRTCLRRYRGGRVTFCALGRVFCITECFKSRFQALVSRTLFKRLEVGRVPFSRFAPPDTFSM